jgi:hypothetical protein
MLLLDPEIINCCLSMNKINDFFSKKIHKRKSAEEKSKSSDHCRTTTLSKESVSSRDTLYDVVNDISCLLETTVLNDSKEDNNLNIFESRKEPLQPVIQFPSWLRSTTTSERLSDLAVIKMANGKKIVIDYESIIDEFASLNNRKLNFF